MDEERDGDIEDAASTTKMPDALTESLDALSRAFERHRDDFVNSNRVGPLYWDVRRIIEKALGKS